MMIAINEAEFTTRPFPHFSCSQVLEDGLDLSLLTWFKNEDLWSLTETDFYTQYEFSLLDRVLPGELEPLVAADTIQRISLYFAGAFGVENLNLVGLTAHKLVHGHRMGVHNDFIGQAESHRLVIQLNDNWRDENGGYLMLFNSKNPQDVSKVVKPLHNSAIGFEISPVSYHAVSTVHDFSRYTLVYTFDKN